MATTHWRKGYSVEQLYQQADANWSFHQLAHLLMGMKVDDESTLKTLTKQVEFKGTLQRSLPAGEIRKVFTVNANDDLEAKHQVECSYYNLTGLDGPLPEPFFDMMREDFYRGKGAMAAFLNIFNNRVHALRYLLHAQNNYTLSNDLASETNIGKFLLALSGHFYLSQRQLHGQQNDTLLALSGHLANCRMALPSIKKLFQSVLMLPVIAMDSLIGRWIFIERNDQSRLGQSNHRLGSEATLGTKVWDQQATFELTLGPVDQQRLSNLVPGGEEHKKLYDLVAWICEKRIDCKITLICKASSDLKTNATRLSHQVGLTNRLGYGSSLVNSQVADKKISFMLDMVS